MPVRSKWQSLPTEAINPATLAIDKQSAADIVEEMMAEDRKMLSAVHREKDRIAVGIDIVTQALKKGGRIVFVGAGTSGRLGIVESAEMPPTFGTRPDLVQAIMAGGRNASRTTTRKACAPSTGCGRPSTTSSSGCRRAG
jgi:N-acetylmuramic acid 6-phosphate etherase